MSFTRRNFLKTVFAAVASLPTPKVMAAKSNPTFWFLHTENGDSWSVEDPVAWCLENACLPILERAKQRLVTLDNSDPVRVIKVVVRRCKLNLIEIRPKRVVVHHWAPQGQADLRAIFKTHKLARKDMEVVLIGRKRETTTVKHGDDFLYGDRLSKDWPLKIYFTKWQRQGREELDDWTAAPHTTAGFAWEGTEANRIPWAALKSVWRRTNPTRCLNCDQVTILTNFGFHCCGMFNRRPFFIHVCQKCKRSFEDKSVRDVPQWLVTNLDAEVWPNFEMVWGKTREWKPPKIL